MTPALGARGWGLVVTLLAATSAGAQTLDARIHAAARGSGVTWVGYRIPASGIRGQMCGSGHITKVILEAPTEVLVLSRIENGALTKLRTVTPDCEIDATGATLVWLDHVAPADSIAWLTSIVARAPQDRSDAGRLVNPALAALSMHQGDAATTALVRFAREHAAARVREQALFWLAHRAGERAVAAITDAIANDPENEVKKRAVFALSQLPKDEGVPKLIELARSNRNPIVRKQAFFWLGQSKDPRAVEFFEEVLLKK